MPRQALGSRLNAAFVDAVDEAEEGGEDDVSMPASEHEADAFDDSAASMPAEDEDPTQTEDLNISAQTAQVPFAEPSMEIEQPSQALQPKNDVQSEPEAAPAQATESRLYSSSKPDEQLAEVIMQSPFAASGPEFEQSEADQLECLEKLPSELLADIPQEEEAVQKLAARSERPHSKGLSRFAPETCPLPPRSASLAAKIGQAGSSQGNSLSYPEAAPSPAHPQLSQPFVTNDNTVMLSAEAQMDQEDGRQSAKLAVEAETTSVTDREVGEGVEEASHTAQQDRPPQRAASPASSEPSGVLETAQQDVDSIGRGPEQDNQSSMPAALCEAEAQPGNGSADAAEGKLASALARCSLDTDTVAELAALSVPLSAAQKTLGNAKAEEGSSPAVLQTRLAEEQLSAQDLQSSEAHCSGHRQADESTTTAELPAAVAQDIARQVFKAPILTDCSPN